MADDVSVREVLCVSDEEGADALDEDVVDAADEEPDEEETSVGGRLSPLKMAAAATKPNRQIKTAEAAKMMLELTRVGRFFLWEDE